MTLGQNVAYAPVFARQLLQYQRLNTDSTLRVKDRNLYPVLSDYRQSAGIPDWHYFHQDLWAARKIFDRRPVNHIDIGSRIDGFVSHLLVFMPVSIVDIRPLYGATTGLSTIRGDATELRQFESNSVDSLSSLHAAEHFGLGRYSDSVDPNAWKTSLNPCNACSLQTVASTFRCLSANNGLNLTLIAFLRFRQYCVLSMG